MRKLLKFLKIKSYSANIAVNLVNVSPAVKKRFAELISDGSCYVYAKVLFKRALGIAFLFTNLDDKDLADGENTCYVANVFVHPRLRGKGMGSEILNYIAEIARKKGFKQMTIGVDEEIEKNVKLYKRLGFTREIKRNSFDAVLKNSDGKPLAIKEHLILAKDL